MRKAVALLLTVVLLLSGCAKIPFETEDRTEPQTEPETTKKLYPKRQFLWPVSTCV